MSDLQLNGMLLINKPVGVVSKDVSRIITRKFHQKKLGHVGTLDPAACGVLPILLGKATKLQDYLLDSPKTYEFAVKLGCRSDSMDAESEVVDDLPVVQVERAQVEEALATFTGEVSQIPPIYSAVKYKGKPLYQYARSGKASEVPLAELARTVEVYSLELLEFQPTVWRLRVRCSKGTYVRVLGVDLAKSLQNESIVIEIKRTESAGALLQQSVELGALETVENISPWVLPIDEIKLPLPVWLSESADWSRRIRHGQKLLISRIYFDSCLKSRENWLEHHIRSIYLRDELGRVIGIGEARLANEDQVQIKLQRGL